MLKIGQSYNFFVTCDSEVQALSAILQAASPRCCMEFRCWVMHGNYSDISRGAMVPGEAEMAQLGFPRRFLSARHIPYSPPKKDGGTITDVRFWLVIVCFIYFVTVFVYVLMGPLKKSSL